MTTHPPSYTGLTPSQYLLARIAEDEAAAHAATPGPWTHNPRKEWFTDPDKLRAARAGIPQSGGQEFVGAGEGMALGIATTGPACDAQSMADAAHIARHDPARVLAQCQRDRRIIELHDQWPVLVETPPTLEPVDPTDINSMAIRVTQQIAWQTEQQYRERFGTEPPTSQIIAAMLEVYADRDDFPEEWKR